MATFYQTYAGDETEHAECATAKLAEDVREELIAKVRNRLAANGHSVMGVERL